MKVFGRIYQKVEIEPLKFLEELRGEYIHSSEWIGEENGVYYKYYEFGHGSETKDVISNDLYNIINHIDELIKLLKQNKEKS